MISSYRLWMAMMVGLLVSPEVRAQEPTGRLEGVVYLGADRPAEGALVEIVAPGSQRVHTDVRGYFALEGVPTGRISLQVRRIGNAKWRSDSVIVEAGRTTRLEVMLTADHTFDIIQHERWLGCQQDRGTSCLAPRGFLANVAEVVPGIRIFRDSAMFSHFWLTEHRSGFAPNTKVPPIDWSAEMVVAVGLEGYSGCGPQSFVNRVEVERSRLVIVLGPDSLQVGGLNLTCMAYNSTIDLLILPKQFRDITVRPANTKWQSEKLFAKIRRNRRMGT